MPNRHTDRERWEIMIMTILLAFRPLIFTGGCIFLIFSSVAVVAYPIVALISLILAFFLFGMVFLDQVSLYVARFGAWLMTLGRD
jgi:hypothetical protein